MERKLQIALPKASQKWMTNKQKSGKLQASALELPQSRKTIRHRQLHGEKKGEKADRKSQVCWDRTVMPLNSMQLICGSSVSIFSPSPSFTIKVMCVCPPAKKWHQNIIIKLQRGARQAWTVGLTRLVSHSWNSERSLDMKWSHSSAASSRQGNHFILMPILSLFFLSKDSSDNTWKP